VTRIIEAHEVMAITPGIPPATDMNRSGFFPDDDLTVAMVEEYGRVVQFP
jgi:hypothetical protein